MPEPNDDIWRDPEFREIYHSEAPVGPTDKGGSPFASKRPYSGRTIAQQIIGDIDHRYRDLTAREFQEFGDAKFLEFATPSGPAPQSNKNTAQYTFAQMLFDEQESASAADLQSVVDDRSQEIGELVDPAVRSRTMMQEMEFTPTLPRDVGNNAPSDPGGGRIFTLPDWAQEMRDQAVQQEGQRQQAVEDFWQEVKPVSAMRAAEIGASEINRAFAAPLSLPFWALDRLANAMPKDIPRHQVVPSDPSDPSSMAYPFDLVDEERMWVSDTAGDYWRLLDDWHAFTKPEGRAEEAVARVFESVGWAGSLGLGMGGVALGTKALVGAKSGLGKFGEFMLQPYRINPLGALEIDLRFGITGGMGAALANQFADRKTWWGATLDMLFDTGFGIGPNIRRVHQLFSGFDPTPAGKPQARKVVADESTALIDDLGKGSGADARPPAEAGPPLGDSPPRTNGDGADLPAQPAGDKLGAGAKGAAEASGPPSPLDAQIDPQGPIQSKLGDSGVVRTVSGDDVPFRYALVEIGDLVPSHIPVSRDQFIQNEAFPQSAQPRPYHEPSQNAERAKVFDNADNYDPSFIFRDAPDAMHGTPVVTPGGRVIAGNSRVMSAQLLYEGRARTPEEVLHRAVGDNAHRFGFGESDTGFLQQPMVVRMLEETPTHAEMTRLGGVMNESFTQGMNKGALGVSRARQLSQETLNTFTEASSRAADLDASLTLGDTAALDKTIRQAIWNDHGFRDGLINDGIINPNNSNEWLDGAGNFTSDGVKWIEDMMLGTVIRSPDLVMGMPGDVKRRIVRSASSILRQPEGDGDIRVLIEMAMESEVRRRATSQSVDHFIGQADFTNPVPSQVDARVASLHRLIAAKKGQSFKTPTTEMQQAFQKYADFALNVQEGQGQMFGAPQPTVPSLKPKTKSTSAEVIDLYPDDFKNASQADLDSLRNTPHDVWIGLKEGAPTELKVWHGTGASQSDKYAPGAGPTLGSGKYSALDKEAAEQFGKVGERETVTLRNPALIQDDADLKRWASRHQAVPTTELPYTIEEWKPLLADVRKAMVKDGHDGVIINVPRGTDIAPSGGPVKRMREVFGDSQVVEFLPKRKAPEAQVAEPMSFEQAFYDAFGYWGAPTPDEQAVSALRSVANRDVVDGLHDVQAAMTNAARDPVQAAGKAVWNPGDQYAGFIAPSNINPEAPIPKEMISRTGIIYDLMQEMGLTVSQGPFRNRALSGAEGYFRPSTGHMEIKKWGDLQAVGHEFMHALFERSRDADGARTWQQWINAEPGRAYALSRISYDADDPIEGLSELMRLHMTNSDYISGVNSKLYGDFADELQIRVSPDEWEAIRTARDKMHQFMAAGSQHAIREGRMPMARSAGSYPWSKTDGFIAGAYDIHHFWRIFDDMTNGGRTMPGGAWETARLLAGESSWGYLLIHEGPPIVVFQGDRSVLRVKPAQRELAFDVTEGTKVRLTAEESAELARGTFPHPTPQQFAESYSFEVHPEIRGYKHILAPVIDQLPLDGRSLQDGLAQFGDYVDARRARELIEIGSPFGKNFEAVWRARQKTIAESGAPPGTGAPGLSPGPLEQLFNPDDVFNFLDQLAARVGPETMAAYNESFDRLVTFQNTVADFLVDTGVVRKKDRDHYRIQEHAIHFLRQMGEPSAFDDLARRFPALGKLKAAFGRGGGILPDFGKKTAPDPMQAKRGAHRTRGSSRNLRGFEDRLMNGIGAQIQAGMENLWKQQVARQARRQGGGLFAEHIPPGMVKETIGTQGVADDFKRMAQEHLGLDPNQFALKAFGELLDMVAGAAPKMDLWIGGRKPYGDNVMPYFEAGEPRYLKIGDSHMLESLMAQRRAPMSWVTRQMSTWKQLQTDFTTLEAGFMLMNTYRDMAVSSIKGRTMQHFTWAGRGMLHQLDNAVRHSKGKRGNPWLVSSIANGMGGAGLVHGPQDLNAAVMHQARLNNVDLRTVLKNPGDIGRTIYALAQMAKPTPFKAWRGLQRVAGGGEMMSRTGEFQRVLESGKKFDRAKIEELAAGRFGPADTPAQKRAAIDAAEEYARQETTPRHAAFLGREQTVDFGQVGMNKQIQWFAATAPFFNAMMQSQENLGRHLFTDDTEIARAAKLLKAGDMNGFRKAMWSDRRFQRALKLTSYVMASAALHAYNREDPEYKREFDHNRWNYHTWIFRDNEDIQEDGFGRLLGRALAPKLFEMGMLANWGEAAVDLGFSDQDGPAAAAFGRALVMSLWHNYQMPFPGGGIAEGAVQQWANYDFYTHQAIEPEWLQNLPPYMRMKGNTAESMKMLGELQRLVVDRGVVSPVRLENFFESVMSTFGHNILIYGDMAMRKGVALHLDDHMVLRRLMARPGKHNRERSDMYDQFSMIEEMKATHDRMGRMANEGATADVENFARYDEKYTPGLYEEMGVARRDSADLRAREDSIRWNPDETRESRMKGIDAIKQEQDRLAAESMRAIKKIKGSDSLTDILTGTPAAKERAEWMREHQ